MGDFIRLRVPYLAAVTFDSFELRICNHRGAGLVRRATAMLFVSAAARRWRVWEGVFCQQWRHAKLRSSRAVLGSSALTWLALVKPDRKLDSVPKGICRSPPSLQFDRLSRESAAVPGPDVV